MKQKIAMLLVIALLCSVIVPVYAADMMIISYSNGNIYMEIPGNTQKIIISIVKDGDTKLTLPVYPGERRNITVGLPTRRVPLDTYTVLATAFDESGRELATGSVTATFGTNEPINSTLPGTDNTPRKSRAIMQPYAYVYSDPAMTNKVASLKRYDYVHILAMGTTTAYVRYHVQSGNGTISVNEIEGAPNQGIYFSSDDLEGVGYVYVSDFNSPSLNATTSEAQRDVVELAYSRLGTQGVYNQARRFQECYLDCAALVMYYWYQLGYDLSEFAPACGGIVTWGMNHGAVMWQATPAPEIVAGRIEEVYHPEPPAPEEPDPVEPGEDDAPATEEDPIPEETAPAPEPEPVNINELLYSYGTETLTLSDLTAYADYFDPADFALLQPGDLILWNYTRTIACPDGSTFQAQITNGHSDFGHDHVALVVGVSKDADGNVYKVTYIESFGASEVPMQNTKVSVMSVNSTLVNDIVFVIRPVGGEPFPGRIENPDLAAHNAP